MRGRQGFVLSAGFLVAVLFVAGTRGADASRLAGVRVVPCSEVIGTTRFPYRGSSQAVHRYRQVLGAVAVPPVYMAQIAETGDPRWPFWRKQGLVIQAVRAPVTVTVPREWRDRVAIEWGYGGTGGPFHTLRIAGCPSDPTKGNAYSGGFHLRRSSDCVPLRFTVAGRSATVRFGLGRRCAGGS